MTPNRWLSTQHWRAFAGTGARRSTGGKLGLEASGRRGREKGPPAEQDCQDQDQQRPPELDYHLGGRLRSGRGRLGDGLGLIQLGRTHYQDDARPFAEPKDFLTSPSSLDSPIPCLCLGVLAPGPAYAICLCVQASECWCSEEVTGQWWSGGGRRRPSRPQYLLVGTWWTGGRQAWAWAWAWAWARVGVGSFA